MFGEVCKHSAPRRGEFLHDDLNQEMRLRVRRNTNQPNQRHATIRIHNGLRVSFNRSLVTRNAPVMSAMSMRISMVDRLGLEPKNPKATLDKEKLETRTVNLLPGIR